MAVQQIPPHKAHRDLPQLVQLGTVNVTVNKQDCRSQNKLDDKIVGEHHADHGHTHRQQKAAERPAEAGDGAVVILPGHSAVQKHRRIGRYQADRGTHYAKTRNQHGAHGNVGRNAHGGSNRILERLAGNGVAVHRAFAQDGEHHGQHHQRKVGQAGRFGREDDEDDILKHDQQTEKAEDQQVQQIMDAANALLLGAVMRVDIGAPVGGKTGLNGGDKLGQGVGEIKRTLLRRGGVIA